MPWFAGAVYWSARGEKFEMPSGDIAFSVTIYCICAAITIGFLLARRFLKVFGKGELGGPVYAKWCCSIIFTALWIAYILLSSFETYGYIPGRFGA